MLAAAILVVGALLVPALVGPLAPTVTPRPVTGGSPAASVRPSAPANNSSLGCDGMYWASGIWATYDPSYCYGHDEPTMSYISNASGSGEDASFRFVLPADGVTYAQGDFMATIWFGGTVHDVDSNDGNDQAFLEFQFYPAAPSYTLGTDDCLPNGGFYYNFGPGMNEWFACAIVWQLSNGAEDAAFAGPLDVAESSSILVLHSNDVVYLNYSGVAKSTTQGWKLSVNDTTAGLHGSVTLVNGSLVLSPEYSTASPANTLVWGASNPGAIAFAYEIGHALDPAIPEGGPYDACYPGDGVCDSYWPGRWAQAGQMDLELPVVGGSGSQTYPTQVKFSSSQGGEYWINESTDSYSTCLSPNASSSTNCLYPWYQYRSGSYGFTFDTSNVTNATHNYGSWYQFPSTTSGGQWNGNYQTAPWGTLATTVSPLNATVEFNRIGETDRLTLAANGTAGGQFEEGPYWLNVSATGCTPTSTFVYMMPTAVDKIPSQLSCYGATPLSAAASGSPLSGTAPLEVNFTGTHSGGKGPDSYSWNFGDSETSTVENATHNYTSAGTYEAVLTVTDSNHDTASASVLVTVQASLSVRASANPTSGAAPLAVDFSSTPSGGSGGYAYAWTFGDGGTSSSQNPAHTYTTAGTFTARLNVTDSSHHKVNASLPITVTPPVLFAVQFNESGLVSGTNWTVTLSGSAEWTLGTNLTFLVTNGSHPYNVSVKDTRFHPTTAAGTIVVSGIDQYLEVSFVPTNYSITFSETSLPTGVSWSVALAGQLKSTAGAQLVFEQTNGSYDFTVTQPPGFSAEPLSGVANVSGENVAKTVNFSAIQYRVTFSQTGLPSGTRWNVTLGGQHGSSTGNSTNFTVPNGTYSYSLTTIGGYRLSPASGSVSVDLANRSVSVTATPVLYAVTFTEVGLPNDTSWTVTIDGGPHSSTTTTLTVSLANGSYSYSVTPPSGYSVSNGTGTVRVLAGPQNVNLDFGQSNSNAGSGILGGTNLYLALAAIAVIVAGTVIYVVGARRRKRESSPPPPPTGTG